MLPLLTSGACATLIVALLVSVSAALAFLDDDGRQW